MIKKIFQTSDDFAATLARLGLGLVMFPHGAQKALGWFGGYGFAGTMGFFTNTMHIPWIFALLAVLAEFLGSIGLIVGFCSRIAALGITVNMIMAILMVHKDVGFFMNWMGAQKGEGFEYHVLAIFLGLIVMIRGSGCYSIDKLISNKT
jgi:putative oxidoreductase